MSSKWPFYLGFATNDESAGYICILWNVSHVSVIRFKFFRDLEGSGLGFFPSYSFTILMQVTRH
jgi:hypothetical protein